MSGSFDGSQIGMGIRMPDQRQTTPTRAIHVASVMALSVGVKEADASAAVNVRWPQKRPRAKLTQYAPETMANNGNRSLLPCCQYRYEPQGIMSSKNA